ncbi:extensin [Iris pallida]|uniref:Extensin n=1 Tax=Iris pallida TaxID=29817 RepID=A0AAX6ENI4_IRIPA|nr:extensin [Iris pallida]KAJ6853070.1 extensin [Iris pallida]
MVTMGYRYGGGGLAFVVGVGECDRALWWRWMPKEETGSWNGDDGGAVVLDRVGRVDCSIVVVVAVV